MIEVEADRVPGRQDDRSREVVDRDLARVDAPELGEVETGAGGEGRPGRGPGPRERPAQRLQPPDGPSPGVAVARRAVRRGGSGRCPTRRTRVMVLMLPATGGPAARRSGRRPRSAPATAGRPGCRSGGRSRGVSSNPAATVWAGDASPDRFWMRYSTCTRRSRSLATSAMAWWSSPTVGSRCASCSKSPGGASVPGSVHRHQHRHRHRTHRPPTTPAPTRAGRMRRARRGRRTGVGSPAPTTALGVELDRRVAEVRARPRPGWPARPRPTAGRPGQARSKSTSAADCTRKSTSSRSAATSRRPKANSWRRTAPASRPPNAATKAKIADVAAGHLAMRRATSSRSMGTITRSSVRPAHGEVDTAAIMATGPDRRARSSSRRRVGTGRRGEGRRRTAVRRCGRGPRGRSAAALRRARTAVASIARSPRRPGTARSSLLRAGARRRGRGRRPPSSAIAASVSSRGGDISRLARGCDELPPCHLPIRTDRARTDVIRPAVLVHRA